MDPLDYRKSHDRCRFYLDRGLRKQVRGAGSNLRSLMEPRREAPVKAESLFNDVTVMVVGGVAARAYAPERQTKNIDFIIEDERFGEASAARRRHDWRKQFALVFPNASLGLHKQAWGQDGQLIDIMSTDQLRGVQACKTPHYD